LGDATFIQSGLFRGLGTGGGSTTNLRLEDLSDVTISSLSNDQFLRYNSTSGAWENETVTFGTVTNIATTAPITGGPITTTGTIGITQSGASTDGYLSSTDWNTFNNKASDAFKTIAVSGQSDVVADSATDTLTFVAGSNVTITTDDATDSITINSTGSTAGSGTTNQIAKWASSTTLGDSSISDVGTAGTKININSSGTATFDNEVYSLNSFIIQSDTFESQILMFNSSGTSAYWRVGIDSASANYLAFSTGGGAPYDNHVVISRVDNGRLGVKTAAPTKTLHVAGDAIIENDATFEESIQLEGGFRPDAKTITSSSGSSNTASAQSHIIFNEWTGGAGTGTVYLPSIYGYGTYNPVFRFLASANISASNIIRIYPNASDIGTNINGLAYVELASAYAVVSVIGIAGQWYILDSR
jgi:hypothetical protein